MKEYLFFQNHKHHLQRTQTQGGARPKTSDASGSDKLMSRLAEHDKDMAASRPMT